MPEEIKNQNAKRQKIFALIVAAGESTRMNGGLPKPYQDLYGQSVLRRVVELFREHPLIDGIKVVIRREHHPYYRKAIEGLTIMPCVIGGSSRQESVRLGLEAIAHHQPDLVLVHDVARPMASAELISRIIAALGEHEAIIPTLKIADTIKRVAVGGVVADTISRENLVSVQTPQGFHYETLVNAHKKARGRHFTDDAAVCEFAGVPVFTVDGENDNFKITIAEDLARMANSLYMNHETRMGIGYDVHQLAVHDSDTPVNHQIIKICGIKIPYTHYLVGNSDADVGLHAIVDAILGAIGAGDIGEHFSPDDISWKGADSERFLLYAYQLLTARGGELINMDCIIIGERPKISQHRKAMIDHLAKLLKLDANRISIKATTTEKLGFEGRGEGLAAQAVVTVRLPHS